MWSSPERLLAAVLCALALAGCGFQLRGTQSIPAGLSPIHVQADRASRLAGELRRELERNGVEVASSRDKAASEIELLGENRRRDVLSVSPETTNVEEFQLTYSVRWTLRDTGEQRRTLIPATTFDAQRDYIFDRTAVLAEQGEEETLIDDIQQDLAQRILFRLQAWDPSQAPDPDSTNSETE